MTLHDFRAYAMGALVRRELTSGTTIFVDLRDQTLYSVTIWANALEIVFDEFWKYGDADYQKELFAAKLDYRTRFFGP